MTEPIAKGDLKTHFITMDDLDVVVKLHEDHINFGESIRPHFYEVLANPENIALKCCLDSEIVGVNIFTKGIELSGKQDALVERLNEMAGGRSAYSGDAVVVKPEFRKHGVADSLCSAAVRELRRRNAELAVFEIWTHPDGRKPAKRMLLRSFNKYTSLGHFDGFYRDFYKFGYLCPICGFPCKCSAEIILCEVPQIDDPEGNPI